jgi:DNA mismatch repair ATPase MutL
MKNNAFGQLYGNVIPPAQNPQAARTSGTTQITGKSETKKGDKRETQTQTQKSAKTQDSKKQKAQKPQKAQKNPKGQKQTQSSQPQLEDQKLEEEFSTIIAEYLNTENTTDAIESLKSITTKNLGLKFLLFALEHSFEKKDREIEQLLRLFEVLFKEGIISNVEVAKRFVFLVSFFIFLV